MAMRYYGEGQFCRTKRIYQFPFENDMSTKTYLFIQRSQPRPSGQVEAPSPAQMDEMYAKFNSWKEKFQKNIVDMGGKLGDGKVVRLESTIDGPFVEAKEVVGGYMIVSADTIDEAVEVARESPGIFPGSSVEIREISKP